MLRNAPPSARAVEKLLLWRDVKASGAVVAAVTAVYLGVVFLPFPFTTLLCYSLMLAVATFALWHTAGGVLGR